LKAFRLGFRSPNHRSDVGIWHECELQVRATAPLGDKSGRDMLNMSSSHFGHEAALFVAIHATETVRRASYFSAQN